MSFSTRFRDFAKAISGIQLFDSTNDTDVELRGTDGAAHVMDYNEANPRYMATPEISGVPAKTLLANSNSGTIQAVRVAFFTNGSGSDSLAADLLANGIDEMRNVFPGDSEPFISDAAITDVYAIVVGDGGTDAGADNIVDSSTVKNVNGQLATTVGTVAMDDVTPAQLLAATNMVHWTFAEGLDVRNFNIKVSSAFSTATKAYIECEGVSYA